MTTATFILLIVLSAALFIMIVLSIVAVIFVIAILRSLRRITSRAEATTQGISELFFSLGKRVAPAALSTMVAALLRKIRGKNAK